MMLFTILFASAVFMSVSLTMMQSASINCKNGNSFSGVTVVVNEDNTFENDDFYNGAYPTDSTVIGKAEWKDDKTVLLHAQWTTSKLTPGFKIPNHGEGLLTISADRKSAELIQTKEYVVPGNFTCV